jgi:hypothetical protein
MEDKVSDDKTVTNAITGAITRKSYNEREGNIECNLHYTLFTRSRGV